MRFGFLKRKKKELKKLSLYDVEKKIIEEIEKNERIVGDIIKENSKKLSSLIQQLIYELKKLDTSKLHPRIAGIAKNFKSSMLELWKDLDLNHLNYEKIRKNMEKIALFKLKHFKLLFSVNPEEINRINGILGEIAEVISTIEGRINSVAFNELDVAMNEIKRLKDIQRIEQKIEKDKARLMGKLNNYEDIVKETSEITAEIRKVEDEIESLNLEITRKEDYVKKLIATVRKPMRSYAHNIGSKVNFDDFIELQSISKKVMTEIVKGTIKVKSSQTNVLSALKEIGEGVLIEKVGEIDRLKRILVDKKLELQKLRAKIPKFNAESIEKEIESIDSKMERLKNEYDDVKSSLENRVSKIFGFDVLIEN